jgi:hypothetical protein
MADLSAFDSHKGRGVLFAPPMAAEFHNKGLHPVFDKNRERARPVIIDVPFETDGYNQPKTFKRNPGRLGLWGPLFGRHG